MQTNRANGRPVHLDARQVTDDSRYADYAAGLCASAFPPEEQMPFETLRSAADRPGCEFVVFFDRETPVGVTFTMQVDAIAFVLYLVTDPAVRSSGYGSAVLDCIKETSHAKTIVLEVEPLDPDAENHAQRAARYRFYERNGFTRAGYRAEDMGVEYDILVWGNSLTIDEFESFVARLPLLSEDIRAFQ